MSSLPIKILIVEDNRDQAELMRLALRNASPPMEAEVVYRGKDCLDRCQETPFEAILLDYRLPDVTGLEVIQLLRSRSVQSPVIMVTGQGDEKIAVQAMKQGAYDYIVKEPGFLKTLPKVVLNVIEKHLLRQELERKDSFLRNFAQHVDEIIFGLDAQGRFNFINPKIEELGYSQEEILGQPFSLILLHPLETDFSENIQRSPKRKNWEIDFKDKGGHVRNMLISLTPLYNRAGTLEGYLGTAKDITEKKKMELQILESKRRLQNFFDSVTDYITVSDPEFRVVMVNRKMAEKFRTTPDKLVGRKCYELYFECNTPCKDCVGQRVLETKSPQFSEIPFGEKVFHFWAYPELNSNGEVEHIIEYVRDVTDQKRIEKNLIQSEKLATVGLLASGIAHELRNPLNIIETARYYLEDTLDTSGDDIRNKLEIIKKNVRRASSIINNLLEFSRPSLQDREEIDVNTLIDKTLSLIEKELYAQNITVIRDYGDIPRIYFSLDSLKQAFLNIIINAVEAMPQGGKLYIRTRREGQQWVEIKFTDTGYGIAEEDLPHIFTPFFTTKKVGKGTGLGMFVTHSILKREGGEISVESAKGKGTTFTVLLPLRNKTPAFRGHSRVQTSDA